MFSLFRRQSQQLTTKEYEAEFRRYKHEFGSQFTVGNSPQEQVFFAVSYINTELGRDGAGHWIEMNDRQYLDTLREHLTAERSFTPMQLRKIRESLDEIEAGGREMEQRGESSRKATEAIDCLVMRVIDWLRLHPKSE